MAEDIKAHCSDLKPGMSSALRKLTSLVASEDWSIVAAHEFFTPQASGSKMLDLSQRAFFGSLDAAKDLHEAIFGTPLAGRWEWSCDADGTSFSLLRGRVGDADFKVVDADLSAPSRAWLLCILRALEAEGEGE